MSKIDALSVGRIMKFTTAEIVSAGTGRLVCDIENLCKVFNFLTGESLFTHQLPRAFHACKLHLESQFPWLKDLDESQCTTDNWKEWLGQAESKYGQEHDLKPMPQGLWTHIDPVEEAENLVGKERVISIQT